MNHLAFIIGYNSAWFLMIILAIVSFIIQWRFKSKFNQLNRSVYYLSSREVAESMLRDNQMCDVEVVSVDGWLTDHYNPKTKTMNLSPDGYNSRSVAAAAVVTHKCGHAVQHARSYAWLKMRSSLVPVINVASSLTQWTLFIGVMLFFFTQNPFVPAIDVAALALVTLFSLITLPVEFDASNRALICLKNNYNVMETKLEHEQAKDALWWAAMTYVIAALGSLATLFYYASFLFNRRN